MPSELVPVSDRFVSRVPEREIWPASRPSLTVAPPAVVSRLLISVPPESEIVAIELVEPVVEDVTVKVSVLSSKAMAAVVPRAALTDANKVVTVLVELSVTVVDPTVKTLFPLESNVMLLLIFAISANVEEPDIAEVIEVVEVKPNSSAPAMETVLTVAVALATLRLTVPAVEISRLTVTPADASAVLIAVSTLAT